MDWLTDDESFALLRLLFPHVLRSDAVVADLCPGGWAASPLRLAVHPTPEQQQEDAVSLREGLERMTKLLGRNKPADDEAEPSPAPPEELPPIAPMPDLEALFATLEQDPQPETDADELGRLLGQCLWDVLSDNHELILPDGRVRHLGSFRATAGIIADFFHQREPGPDVLPFGPDGKFDITKLDMSYCEFYMGTSMIHHRTDLSPIYRYIFQRLQAIDCAWQYTFPRLGVVRLEKPESPGDPPEWENYDPVAALAAQEKKKEDDAQFAKMQADLEKSYRESLEAAKLQPPPKNVLAYEAVFGHMPAGWPPWE